MPVIVVLRTENGSRVVGQPVWGKNAWPSHH